MLPAKMPLSAWAGSDPVTPAASAAPDPTRGLRGWDGVHQGEPALTVHGDDVDGLAHVVVLGEAERSQRSVDRSLLQGRLESAPVPGQVVEDEGRFPRRLGEEVDRRVGLRREL